MSKKCLHCGLVNWEHEVTCKRCSAALHQETPPVYRWFVAYCMLMALMYLATAVMGIAFMFVEPEADMSAAEQKIMSVVFLVVGILFFVPFAAVPFLPRQSWVWVFGLVLICLGLSSACCLPVCVPLLIFWLKPEMKAYYGKYPNPLTTPPPPPQWS